MNALRELRKYILIKAAEGNPRDIRPFIHGNLQRLSFAFRVPPQTIVDAVASVSDDNALACKMLQTTLRAEDLLKKQREERRAQCAQASADTLGASVRWENGRAHLDMVSLLASVLTKRNDMLVFQGDTFRTGVYMAPLLDLSRISRARVDLSGWVDRDGLHLAWRSGRLNLFPQENPRAAAIVVPLVSARTVVAA